MSTQTTRSQGCLLGLAVGDALGTTLEFTSPGSFEPLTDMIGGILWALIHGAEKDEVLSAFHHPAGNPWHDMDPAIARIAAGSFKENNPPDIRGTGYVAQSLEAALWAFHRSSSFEEGALLAVNLGEDADTTGAVFGRIAGACYGLEGIPSHWLKRLHQRERILDFANLLIS